MKKIFLLAVLLLGTRLAVMAQSDFLGNPSNGSLSGFGVGINPNPYNNGITLQYGTAIAFTPLQTFTLNSVTLWLSGYTGANNMSINCYIADDPRDSAHPDGIGATSPLSPSYPNNFITQLSSPAFNDGSLAAFNFSGNVTLYANLVYYIYLTGNDAGNASFGVSLAASDVPSSSNAIYNGTERWQFDIGGNLGDSGLNNSYSPAFEINPVPEPGPTALLAGGSILGLMMRYRCVQRMK